PSLIARSGPHSPGSFNTPHHRTLPSGTGSNINRRQERGEQVTSGRDRIRRGRRPLRARAARPGSLTVVALAVLPLAVLLLAGCGTAGYGAPVAPSPMTVSGAAFVSGTLAHRYTCQGKKINPPLNWSAAPPGTKSLALIVDDSSAPITPFIYWLV